MLQQTVVATVIPYFDKFLSAYPTISALAAAPVDEVLGMWAGLGYYARARNLHAGAKIVAALGAFPNTINQLRALPGIGSYTANAIAAIAFNLPVLPVDGNVERVAARIYAIRDPLPAAKPKISMAAGRFMDDPEACLAPGDFAQALFDLGATLCTSRNPSCPKCPWRGACRANALDIAATLPVRAKKPDRPHRTGDAYVLLDRTGQVLLIRRPSTGLLGGMLALPETPPVKAQWKQAGAIEHVFTHFSLSLHIHLTVRKALPAGCLCAPARNVPLPSVMRKALDAALKSLDDQA